MGEKGRVMAMAVFIIIVTIFSSSFMDFEMNLTGYAIFNDIGGGQTTVTLQEAGIDNLGDAYVISGNPNSNVGSSDEIHVSGGTGRRYGYLSFNISGVPVNQIIDNASLCLYLFNDVAQISNVYVHHVYSGFDESALTFNNQPCGTGFDDAVNCNLSAEDLIVTDGSDDDTWQCFDVVNSVDVEYSNSENVSFALFTTDGSSSYDRFYSKEYGDSALRPYLDITYHAANGVPNVSIDLPVEGSNYNYNESLNLNFSVSDDNLAECWYNIDGGENVSLDSCLNSSFDVSDGAHVLNLYVNDSFGVEVSDVVNFNVDVGGVFVSIVQPVGEKGSRTGIVLDYTVLGAESCWYNVETSIGGEVVGNTSLVDCNSSSFDVASDGDYVVNVFGNNSLGSFGMDNSSFSVDTSVPVVPVVVDGGSSGGSGGSGGGGAALSSGGAKLEVEDISVIVSIGEEKSLVVSVKNVGRVSANKCNLVGDEDYVDSSDISNIGVGEIVEFGLVLSAVDGVEDSKLSVSCLDNVSSEVSLDVTVLRPELDVSIEQISFDEDGKLFVGYSIDAVDNRDETLYFRVVGSDDVVVEVSQDITLVFGEVYKGDVSIDVSTIGEGMLRISIGDDEAVDFVEEDFIYEGNAMTGFVGLNVDGTTTGIGVVVFLFLIAAGFIVRRIWKLKKSL